MIFNRISSNEFRQLILTAGFVDLETTGPFFTWRSSHAGPIVTSRLDRFLASDSFMEFWASISATVLPRAHSDHHPLL